MVRFFGARLPCSQTCALFLPAGPARLSTAASQHACVPAGGTRAAGHRARTTTFWPGPRSSPAGPPRLRGQVVRRPDELDAGVLADVEHDHEVTGGASPPVADAGVEPVVLSHDGAPGGRSRRHRRGGSKGPENPRTGLSTAPTRCGRGRPQPQVRTWRGVGEAVNELAESIHHVRGAGSDPRRQVLHGVSVVISWSAWAR